MNADSHRTAIITGAAQGIGKATARRLLRDDFAVVIADLDAEAGRETEAELQVLGDVLFVETDVGSEDGVVRLAAKTVETFGRIDAVVNNAGIGANRPLARLALAEWNRVLATNLTGAFLCAKHTAEHLRVHRGAIVNIASTRALQSEPNTEAYAASKGGIVALTHALAMSLAPEVRVNCVSPGWIDVTPWKKRSNRKAQPLSAADHAQHPAGRVGRPEDVADMVAYLLSFEAAFITGQNFVVDGGMTRKMIYI
ncbi:MAG TPA: glucose 1-dehydrogenase [Burkholderiales bacterium]|jgi:NAD(P)-dependent dehydrogenase (short-subunit alcohol dehydrogenase family)